MNWKIVSAVLAVVVLVLGGILIKGLLDDVEEPPVVVLPTDPQETPVEPERALELARQFRPVLKFDSSERWRPLEIDQFLEESHAKNEFVHRLCDSSLALGDPMRCESVGGIDRLLFKTSDRAQGGLNHYLDIAGSQPNGVDFRTPEDDDCGVTDVVLDCNAGPRTAIYYNVRNANGRFYIDYWWFYRYNDFPEFDAAQRCESGLRPACGDHEGDWEGITVVTSPTDSTAIEYVSYAAHNGTNRYAAPQLDFDPTDSTRPVVFVANGSHASYPDACLGELFILKCQQLAGKLVGAVSKGLPEGVHDGAQDWGRNAGELCGDDPEARRNTECLQPLPPASDRENWNAYAGLWGRICAAAADCPVVRGPRSPGAQPRYREPWCAYRVAPDGNTVAEKRSCDVFTPSAGAQGEPGVGTRADCDAWGGASVALLACDRDSLAETLSSDEADDLETISIRIGRMRIAAGETATRGVAQVVRDPIAAGTRVSINGRVSDVLVRARQPTGSIPEDLVEARFTDVGLRAGVKANVRIRYRDGRVRVSIKVPSENRVIRPDVPPVRPLQAPEAPGP